MAYTQCYVDMKRHIGATSKQVELHCHLGGHRRVAEARNLMCSKDVQRIMSAGNSMDGKYISDGLHCGPAQAGTQWAGKHCT